MNNDKANDLKAYESGSAARLGKPGSSVNGSIWMNYSAAVERGDFRTSTSAATQFATGWSRASRCA